MTRHAYQWRPIRGRRFDPVRALVLIAALVGGVLFWWAVAMVAVSMWLGWPR